MHVSANTLSLGPDGYVGQPGRKGARGPLGKAAQGTLNSFHLTRHSQSIQVPNCPQGTTFIYSGYSLLFIHGNKRAHGQDLGNIHAHRSSVLILAT